LPPTQLINWASRRRFAKLAALCFRSGASHAALTQATCINADYSHSTEPRGFSSESGRASGTSLFSAFNSDRIDARKLADLSYMNKIKPVYHGEHGLRMLKELSRSYLTISKDLGRVMNRLKGADGNPSWVVLVARISHSANGRKVY
jgi:hypothetical protein